MAEEVVVVVPPTPSVVSVYGGVQGEQGPAGATGPAGAAGATGPSNILTIGTVVGGSTAAVTISGTSPAQILSFVLPKGDTGATGATGATGPQGVKGDTGTFGGATFKYTFLTDTSDTDPGSGSLKFNNSLASSTQLYIDYNDSTGADVSSFLTTIDDSSSSIKGTFKIYSVASPNNYAYFSIVGLHTHPGTYFKVPVAFVSSTVSSFSNTEAIAITFSVNGDKGDTGATGPQGVQGPTGATGPANTLTVGTVTTGTAAATITGTAPNQTLNLVLQTGPTGSTGATGPANTLSIGTVTSGTTPSATVTGTAPNQTLNLVLQQGPTGPDGTSITNLDGGSATTNYVGITAINCGGA